jgi:hypothetical protein
MSYVYKNRIVKLKIILFLSLYIFLNMLKFLFNGGTNITINEVNFIFDYLVFLYINFNFYFNFLYYFLSF